MLSAKFSKHSAGKCRHFVGFTDFWSTYIFGFCSRTLTAVSLSVGLQKLAGAIVYTGPLKGRYKFFRSFQ